ncbi:hypothetical protein ACG2LH_16095, partial [Zhouia sp. PK063]|uniref:hypothetical protein n=1 Tax=Zhouia sp. PK063 TaxID=3373602 RepID=UPI00379CF5A2
MKPIILISTAILSLIAFTHQIDNIDPTGTYQLGHRVKNKSGAIQGYFGTIQVKKIAPEKIAVTFDVNKGAPSYNSGSFVDTLTYKNNTAVYGDCEFDASCKITFNFDTKGVKVKESTDDFNNGCGFGHAVIADGYYRCISH